MKVVLEEVFFHRDEFAIRFKKSKSKISLFEITFLNCFQLVAEVKKNQDIQIKHNQENYVEMTF